jgi:hypothetical protein
MAVIAGVCVVVIVLVIAVIVLALDVRRLEVLLTHKREDFELASVEAETSRREQKMLEAGIIARDRDIRILRERVRDAESRRVLAEQGEVASDVEVRKLTMLLAECLPFLSTHAAKDVALEMRVTSIVYPEAIKR